MTPNQQTCEQLQSQVLAEAARKAAGMAALGFERPAITYALSEEFGVAVAAEVMEADG